MRGLGVQTSSSSGTCLSAAETRFIPTSAIQDIFLHEAFKGFEVKFYLAIVVEGEEDLVVVFPVWSRRSTSCTGCSNADMEAENLSQAPIARTSLAWLKGLLVRSEVSTSVSQTIWYV